MAMRDWFWVVLLGAIWGCSFLFNAILIREVGPLWVSAGRVGIGAAGSWIVALALRKRFPKDLGTYAGVFVLGTVMYAVPFALFPLSQAHIASGVAAIVNAMTPITTVIVSQVWPGGERATWNKSLGVLAGFSGAVVLTLPALRQGAESELWAIGACLLATLCYAIGLNYTRRFSKMDPTVLATTALTSGAIVAAILAFFAEGVPHVTRPETWGAFLGIGLLSTTLAFQIMYRLLPRIGATNFSVVTFIAPISAILLGFSLLGETIAPSHVVGMLGIFLGLLFIDGRVLKRLRRARA